MNKFLILSFLSFLSLSFYAQNKAAHGSNLAGFDKEAAWKQAQKVSSKPATQKEYFQFLMRKYAADKQNTSAVINATVPYSANYNAASKTTTINLNPLNANCNDFGFETMNYNNWTGDTWTLSGLDWTTAPTWTGGIVTMGTNTTAQAYAGFTGTNRMTLMTIPPTVNNPPANCIGWDSIAVNPVGHVSGIPFVPPTGSGVTCRLGNANTGSETERLRYNLAVTSANSQINVSYAVVLQNPGHPINTQPFFQINMYDQNGNPIAGCGNYQVDATMAVTDPTFVSASRWDAFGGTWTDPGSPSYYDSLFYKPWTQVGVDLTPYIGTTITLEFRTGDCAYGGHFGYAYVDASCSPSTIQVNMCPGYPNQDAIAPPGYTTYQWFGPNSPTLAIPAPNGTNDTLTIINGSNGDVYYLNAISANGCTTVAQAILQVSTVGISFTNSTPTCPGGNSGTASIVPTGSPGTYTYQWTNSSGTTVSTTNPATGLAPGTYTVHVASTGCGSHDTTVTVGIAPPITTTTTKNFCGSAAILTAPAGAMNIQWYDASGTAIAAPMGTNDSLLATNTSNGQVYSVVYSQGGCFDSLRITLTQVAGGTLSHTGIQNVCIGASNGQAQVVLTTTATPAAYNYQMTGPGGFNQTYTGVSTTSFTLTGLSYGNYTVTAFDGMCFYGDVFKLDTIPMPVYLTVAPKALCSSDSAYINYTFGGAPPTQCQLSSSGCINPSTHYVGPANSSNFNTSYPTPFGNWYTKMKAQYIYTAAELNAAGINAGKINSIQFNVTQIDPTAATIYPDFNIGIGCTTQSTFSVFPAQTDLIPGTVNVYSNAAYPVTLGLNTFNFTQAYDWDGISNIVIEVCFEFPGQVNYTYNCVVDNTTSTNYPSLTIVSDTDPLCAGLTAGAFYYTSSQQMRPTATFGWCSSVATPNMYTYNLSPNIGVLNAPINPPNQTIIQPPSTTSYTFTTTSLVGNCTKKDTFTISIVAPFNIHMPPPVSFCTNDNALGVNATFTDAGTGLPTTVSSFWSGPGISSNNGVGTATFTPASAGVGTHTLMVTAGGQCMMKDSVIYTVNSFLSAQISQIGPFCIYDAPVIIPQVSAGGTWTGPVGASGLFTPSTAGVSSNLTPPYHLIKYVMNAGSPCADSSSIQVQVFDKPLVNFTTDTTQGCAPNVGIQFNSIVSPSGGTYKWVFNNGQASTSAAPQIVYALPGTYSPKLTYVDPNGCRDSITKTGLIIVHPSPVASFDFSPDHTSILEPHINFINTTSGGNGSGNTWLWNIADLKTATTKNTDYEFADAGLYQVTLYVTNQFNCKDSAVEFIKIDPDYVLYVPSGFTPNSDGKNDVFMAEAFGVKNVEGFKMQCYDRWGGKLFESGDIYKGWDGTKGGEMLEEGIYIYTINYKDSTGKMHTKSGQVSLIK